MYTKLKTKCPFCKLVLDHKVVSAKTKFHYYSCIDCPFNYYASLTSYNNLYMETYTLPLDKNHNFRIYIIKDQFTITIENTHDRLKLVSLTQPLKNILSIKHIVDYSNIEETLKLLKRITKLKGYW